jgi:hypothetical protein
MALVVVQKEVDVSGIRNENYFCMFMKIILIIKDDSKTIGNPKMLSQLKNN